MTRLLRHRIFRRSLIGMAALLIAPALSIPARGAIASGPINTNAVGAERQRMMQFYEAEQSFQEQLKVGRERYNQKQINRAKVIAAMTSELGAWQQTVLFRPEAAPDRQTVQPAGWFLPSLALAALAIYFAGLGYRFYRLQAEYEWGRKRRLSFRPAPSATPKSMAEGIFFCKGDGAYGRGRYSKEGVLVLKGSIGRKESAPSAEGQSTEPLWSKLLESGVLREVGDLLFFEKDHLFPTPSLAANALMGRAANGWLEWKTEDGVTLDTVQRLEPAKFAP